MNTNFYIRLLYTTLFKDPSFLEKFSEIGFRFSVIRIR